MQLIYKVAIAAGSRRSAERRFASGFPARPGSPARSRASSDFRPFGCSVVAVAEKTKGSLPALLSKYLRKQEKNRAPDRIRTCDLCLRREPTGNPVTPFGSRKEERLAKPLRGGVPGGGRPGVRNAVHTASGNGRLRSQPLAYSLTSKPARVCACICFPHASPEFVETPGKQKRPRRAASKSLNLQNERPET